MIFIEFYSWYLNLYIYIYAVLSRYVYDITVYSESVYF